MITRSDTPNYSRTFSFRWICLAASFALFALTDPALAQTLGRGSDDGISIWRVILALVVCLTLAVMAAVGLKYKAGGRLPFFLRTQASGRTLVLVETLRLSHQTDLCLVDCGGNRLLIAVSAHGAQLLNHAPSAKSTAVTAGGAEA